MKSEFLKYNPNFQYKESVSYFHKKIMSQDEIPVIFAKDSDSLFYKNQIIQSNVTKDISFSKSLFSTHQIKQQNTKLIDLPLNYSSWSSAVLLFCLVVFASVKYNNTRKLQQVFKAFAVPRFFSQLARESNSFTEQTTLILFSIYVVLLSFLITQLYIVTSGVSVGFEGFMVFVKVLTGVALFYLLKIALVSFTGNVFKSGKEASDYILSIYIFGQTMAMVFLPFAVIVAYNFSFTVVWIFLAIFCISYLYRLMRGLVFISASLKVPMYYLFIYLCTLEILPLVILFKYVLLMLY